ncbi:MAG TPA: DNA primase [Candidatus Dojkabacteria bacterium]|nr:DNA primase [Candidatus Dojkabacteria bacterium]
MDQNNQIEEIKNRLDIVQVVGKYVQLKQAGKNFSGLCPFHKEKTPSFIVSPDIQRYKCFGCGETGDIFNFVQKIENIDFVEALEKLAKEAGVDLKRFEKDSKYKRLEDINYLSTKYFYNQLKASTIAMKYVKERGFSDESIKNFGIGYTPKYPKLLDYIQKNTKYSKQELLQSGLFVEKEGKIREKFRDRIMFPIRSSNGKVIAFSGRVLPGNDWGPKYMNSPETPLFHKKDNLFGQYESRQEIRKQDLAILCEGQTDVISAHQAGIKNIVAPLGTGITKEQIEKLSKLTKNFLFFFDSDSAGFKAVVRAFELSSELGVYPYAATPSPYKDIDELLQKDKKLFAKKIKNRTEAFSFILSTYIEDKDLNKLTDVTIVKKFIDELLSNVKDPIIKSHYIEKVAKITTFTISKDFHGIRFSQECPSNKASLELPVKTLEERQELTYLKLLLLLDKVPPKYIVKKSLLTSPQRQKVAELLSSNPGITRQEIYTALEEDPDTREVVEEAIFQTTELPNNKEEIYNELDQIIQRLKKNFYENQRRDLHVKIAIAEEKGEFKQSQKLLSELQNINKILKDI